MINYSISWSSEGASPAAAQSDPFAEGLEAHRHGRFEAAIDRYLQVLGANPDQALACYDLGVALMDAGFGLVSMPFLRRASGLLPSSETLRYALVFALIQSGRLDEAERTVAEAEHAGLATSSAISLWRSWLGDCQQGRDPAELRLSPPLPAQSAPGLSVRPLELATSTLVHARLQEPFAKAVQDYQAGRMEQMIGDLGRLVEESPSWGEGHHLRGLALLALDRIDEAAVALRRASELLPGRAEIWDHLGVVSVRLGERESVRHAFEQALTLNPLRAETWNNAADTAMRQGWLGAAYQYAFMALRLKPDLVQSAFCLLQAAYKIETEIRVDAADSVVPNLGMLARAADAVKRGVGSADQALDVATLLAQIGRYPDACEVLESGLERFEDRQPVLLGKLVQNQRRVCDWRALAERQARLVELIRESDRPVVTPFAALSLPGLDPEDLRKTAHAHACRFQDWADRASSLGPSPAKAAGGRLRIGYLSDDLQEHATAYLTASVFEHHDRSRFECFAYSTGADDGGPLRRRLRDAFEHFVDIRPLGHQEAAQRIRDDGIDILVDLKGYTNNARIEILALRPSPVQVTWLGFPGTLGTSFIDYMVVDSVVVPPGDARFYDEALAYMPGAYAPVDDRRTVAPVPTRAEAGLPERGLVLCCFNDPYKITPEVFDRWCAILKAVPDAILWLYSKTPEVAENLRREAGQRGLDPGRLRFAPKVSQPEHLARLALADLVLDTLPYNAHTTASDALWMGVPVLTCAGETFPSRVAASLLRAAGLSDLITTDLAAYEARAVALGKDPDALAAMKSRLTESRQEAIFFDSRRFAADLESLYLSMWARYRGGQAPARLEIDKSDAARSKKGRS
ncbi:O-linked N-acetylglucosamine transferase, SPINDLY family protein [Imhoffiella purpurea]|uniref:protein O-GlcNAc transferase n=1 Tax=Imhoffiella purpurea TaxID=1249627 RepID=W9W3P6_9GAMM|nr:hypothetical protein [Imhoffiella purpurea]EXJ17185.1 TPR domain protein, putative component of TonB system [Imhoffiella purpurea]